MTTIIEDGRRRGENNMPADDTTTMTTTTRAGDWNMCGKTRMEEGSSVSEQQRQRAEIVVTTSGGGRDRLLLSSSASEEADDAALLPPPSAASVARESTSTPPQRTRTTAASSFYVAPQSNERIIVDDEAKKKKEGPPPPSLLLPKEVGESKTQIEEGLPLGGEASDTADNTTMHHHPQWQNFRQQHLMSTTIAHLTDQNNMLTRRVAMLEAENEEMGDEMDYLIREIIHLRVEKRGAGSFAIKEVDTSGGVGSLMYESLSEEGNNLDHYSYDDDDNDDEDDDEDDVDSHIF